MHVTKWVIVDVGEVADTTTAGYTGSTCFPTLVLGIIITITIIFVALSLSGDGPKAKGTSADRATLPTTPGEASDTRTARLAKDRYMESIWAARVKKEEEAREARIREQMLLDIKRKTKGEQRYTPSLSEKALPVQAVEHPDVRRVPPPKRSAESPLPSMEEMMVLRKVISEALDDLPGGLPSSLSLYDGPTIANRIVKGRKMWSEDGRLLAFIQGNWYYAHPSDAEFMQVFEGP